MAKRSTSQVRQGTRAARSFFGAVAHLQGPDRAGDRRGRRRPAGIGRVPHPLRGVGPFDPEGGPDRPLNRHVDLLFFHPGSGNPGVAIPAGLRPSTALRCPGRRPPQARRTSVRREVGTFTDERMAALETRGGCVAAMPAIPYFGNVAARWSINARTAGGRPRLVVKTRWTMPICARHSGRICTSRPCRSASAQT